MMLTCLDSKAARQTNVITEFVVHPEGNGKSNHREWRRLSAKYHF